MSAQGKKWIVRNPDGHIYGPFPLEKLKDLLSRGVFSGEEDVALYPVGDWMPMSGDAELYELVLAQLAAPVKPAKSKTAVQAQERAKKPAMQKSKSSISFDDNEVTAPLPEEEEPKSPDNTQVVHTSLTRTKHLTENTTVNDRTRILKTETNSPKTKTTKVSQTGPRKKDIDLIDKSRIRPKPPIVPAVLIVVAAFLLYAAYDTASLSRMVFWKGKVSKNLLAPRKTTGQDSQSSQKLLQEGWAYFYRDSYENYLKAQEKFVGSVEKYPGNSDALTMLLMTYLELWPNVKQDSKDQETVQTVHKMATQADPYGSKLPILNSTFDFILGKNNNTLLTIEQGIARQPAEGRLYFLKGLYYLNNTDYRSAAAYFARASTLIPSWARTYYLTGLSYVKLGDVAQAQRFLGAALKINKTHPHALIELGVIEVSYLSQCEKAKQYLTAAIFGGEKLDPTTESRGRYYLALSESKLGNKTVAIGEAEKALRLDPLNPDIRSLLEKMGRKGGLGDIVGDDRQNMALGEQYMRIGNYLGAQGRFKAAFEANPRNARAAVKTAEALWMLRQSGDAIIYLKRAIQADPKFIDSFILLSQYLSEKFDYNGALQILQTAAKSNPNNYQVYRGYAGVYLKLNDLANAESAGVRSIRMYETDSQTNEILARIYMQKNDMTRALQFGKRSVEIDPTNATAHSTFARIKAHFLGPREGVDYLRNLVEVYPTQLQLRITLAELLTKDEQYSSAKQVLQQVLLADENNRDAYAIMGDANLGSNNYNEALRSFASATRSDPSDATSIMKAGQVHMKLAQYGEAAKNFQLALRINPKMPLIHLSLAKAYYNGGDGEMALKELDEEKKANPRHFEAYELAGDITMGQRKFQKAVREYQKASETKPPGAQIYVKLAKANRGLGSLDAAKSMLKIAAAKESGYAEIYREQGLIYETQGLADEAIASFKRYLQLYENAPDREMILGKIMELQ